MKRRLKRKVNSGFKILILIFLFIFILLIVVSFHARIKNLFIPTHFKKDKAFILKPYSNITLLDFEEKLKKSNLLGYKITGNDDSEKIVVMLKEGPVIVFSRNKDIDWQISTLQTIILKLTIENKKPSKIDFTFDKTIVNY